MPIVTPEAPPGHLPGWLRPSKSRMSLSALAEKSGTIALNLALRNARGNHPKGITVGFIDALIRRLDCNLVMRFIGLSLPYCSDVRRLELTAQFVALVTG